MIDQHFVERLSLRDKFSALARTVVALDTSSQKDCYSYFDLKKYMREKHGIDVSRKKERRIKPKVARKMSSPLRTVDPQRWYSLKF